MGKCNMCGQCCMAIHISMSPEYIQERKDWGGDMTFVSQNCVPITYEKACEINPYFKVSAKGGAVDYSKYYFYTCKKLRGNKCTAQGDKPLVCKNYPWYGGEPHPEPFYSPTCGYMEDVKLLESKGFGDTVQVGEPYVFKRQRLIIKRNHKEFSWSYNKSVKMSDDTKEEKDIKDEEQL